MTKELVIERYGPLKYTMGNGGSAASMQQHLLVENYPGLLDGLTTSQVFEDHWTQVQGSLDCRVLMHYFWPTQPADAARATPPRRPTRCSRPRRRDCRCGAAIRPTRTTVRAEGACLRRRPDRARADGERRLRPDRRAALEPGQQPRRRALRDRRLHARGLRRRRSRPTHPTARAVSRSTTWACSTGSPRCSGARSRAEQFVDLNAKVGGIDIDGNFVAHRTAADPDALRIAYETGRVNSGTGAARRSRDRQPHRRARWTTRASIRPTRRSPTARAWTVPTATTTTR